MRLTQSLALFLRPLALSDVHHRSNKLDAARDIIQGMSHNMDMFDEPSASPSEIHDQNPARRAPRARWSVARGLRLRMSPPENEFHGRSSFGRIEKFERILRPDDVAGGNLQPKLPVWLNRCASDKYASVWCSFSSCTSKVWVANRLSTQDVSRASPRTMKVTAAIPPVPSVEMLTA